MSWMKQSLTVCVAVIVLLVGLSTTIEAANRIYWTDAATRKIQRANLDGSGVEDLVDTGASPHGIALDITGGKMYWVEAGGLKIRRANLDGSGVEDLVESVAPAGIALDVIGGKMYWTDVFLTGKIQRANLDGSGVQDLITFVADRPDIALDVPGSKMYWTRGGIGVARIQRANLDGSGLEDLVTTGLIGPRGIALDLAGGKMYWTDYATDKIQRANLDGSGVEDLLTGLGNPAGIALDLAGGKMYWTDFETHKIQRANLDGSGLEDLVTTGLSLPVGIALELEVTIPVTIDIKPGTDRNCINLSSAGVIPVAILSSPTFDATTVDPTTVNLASASVKVVGKSERSLAHLADVNGDGLDDLVVQITTEDFIIEEGAGTAVLEGTTYDGQKIQGEDAICIVPG